MVILRKKILTSSLALLIVAVVALGLVGAHVSGARADGGGGGVNNCTTEKSITSDFNGTPIPGNDFIWFTSVVKVSGLPSQPTWLSFRNQQITFTANGKQYNLSVPDAELEIDSSASSAITWFSDSQWAWQTTSPANVSGNIFLSALLFHVPSGGLPGGINPVTWSGEFIFPPNTSLNLNWQWAAAVYSPFNWNWEYNSLGVKPVDDNHVGPFYNSDHAGTPEYIESYVVGGARGGGGSNFTGSLSSTLSVQCPFTN